jgi:type 1 glutamine amidotransferase
MAFPVLLVFDGLIHPSLAARRSLEGYLRALPGYTFSRARSVEALAKARPAAYRAVVLYYHHKHISSAALAALQMFLQRGGGVLALHSAAASFKDCPEYFRLLGGRFVHHAAVQPVTLRPAETSGLYAGMTAFSIRDELYRHEVFPGSVVHFFAEAGSEREPFVWSRVEDAGRVLYAAPGHTAEALRSPQVREILRRGLAWVCGAEPAGVGPHKASEL